MKCDESARVFHAGFNCAQAVFLPFAKEYGLGEEIGAKVASSFAAGMGRMQETCGAVTGAFMAIGYKYGFAKADDQKQKDIILERTKEFISRFREKFGTLRCRDLLACDLNTEEGQKFHKEQKQRELICTECVKFAASTVEGMMGGDSHVCNE
jgi:C_GCAxxG_C_C family probable redox protein